MLMGFCWSPAEYMRKPAVFNFLFRAAHPKVCWQNPATADTMSRATAEKETMNLKGFSPPHREHDDA
jgi:hypothetical protein